jgi:hypothetical protein
MGRSRIAIRLAAFMMVSLFVPQPGCAQTEARSHPAKTLAAKAGDPTAPVLQYQLTNLFGFSNYNADGRSNL